jgi:acetylornithine/succinyldiaminopimelate/putrescine aminotransferase
VEALQNATNEQTCAIMLEPIQGEGGVNVPNASYLPAVRKWCDEQNLLLIYDEVQTGMCRTGPLFAYEGMGAEPDVMTLAKGLASGVPIGAILAKEHCAVFTPGDHGSTFGGNPLATAAALAVTKFMLETNLPARVEKIGGYLESRLEGLGKTHAAERVVLDCLETRLIVNNVRPNAVRLAPPLTVSEAECDEAVSIIDKALGRVA